MPARRSDPEAVAVVRTPPHSEEAERALVGALLLTPSRIAEVSALVEPADLYDDRRRLVLEAVLAVHARGDPVDAVTVLDEAMRRGTAGDMGGAAHLSALEGAAAGAGAVAHYARIVRRKAELRAIVRACHESAAEAYDDRDDPAELLVALQSRLLGRARDRTQDSAAAFAATIAQNERRRRRIERPLPLPWARVARALGGGLWPGLHVLVGTTGTGKTQFALQTALNAAKAGHPVLYVGLELGPTELGNRLMAMESDHWHWSELHFGNGPPMDEQRATADALARLPVEFLFGPPYGFDPSALLPAVAMLQRRFGTERTALVVFDFLQLVGGDPRADLRERIQAAAYACRAAARDLGVAVLALSGTARENYGRLSGEGEAPGQGNPARLVGLGKESGELEYAADTVLVLAAEPWPTGPDGTPVRPEAGTKMWLAVAKQRAGLTGWHSLRFDGRGFGEFDVDGPHAPAEGTRRVPIRSDDAKRPGSRTPR